MWQSFEAPGFFPGSKILFATVTSDQAYRAEYQTDKEVKEDLLIVLRNMYGAGNVPEPVEFVVKRWTLDPLFRGTFTNWGAGATVKQQLDMRAPLGGELDRERTLWFSGEHTSRKYYGYLHGAYWEGKLAAADVADCLLRGCRESADTKKVKRDEGGEAGGVVERSTGTGRSGKRRMWT